MPNVGAGSGTGFCVVAVPSNAAAEELSPGSIHLSSPAEPGRARAGADRVQKTVTLPDFALVIVGGVAYIRPALAAMAALNGANP